jgi:uncharacterized protein (DUF1697 family)
MPRYISFLRGINLGSRRLKMERLRALFEELKLSNVSTFIASGNVIFDASARNAAALEARVERHLATALGYDVSTFIRTPAEIAAVAGFRPFEIDDEAEPSASIQVIFLRAPLDQEAHDEVLALQTDLDRFCIHEREIYWLCRGSVARPSYSPALFAKAIRTPGTARNVTTVRKIAQLHANGSD